MTFAVRRLTPELCPALEVTSRWVGAALRHVPICRGSSTRDRSNAWTTCPFGRSVTSALITAALQFAKRARAPALEAYPIDTSAPDSKQSLATRRTVQSCATT